MRVYMQAHHCFCCNIPYDPSLHRLFGFSPACWQIRLGGSDYELSHGTESIARGLTSAAIGYLCVATALILPIVFKPTLFRSDDDDFQEVQEETRRRPSGIELKSVRYGSLPRWEDGV